MSTLRHSLRVFRQKTLRLPQNSEDPQSLARGLAEKLWALRVFVVARRQSHGVSSPLRGRSEAQRSGNDLRVPTIQASIMGLERPPLSSPVRPTGFSRSQVWCQHGQRSSRRSSSRTQVRFVRRGFSCEKLAVRGLALGRSPGFLVGWRRGAQTSVPVCM